MIDPAVAEGLRYPLLALAALSIGFSVLLIATTWQSIPKSLPAHFDISGRPDRWSGRWVLFLLVAVQAGTAFAMWQAGDKGLLFGWCMALTSILMAYVIWGTIRVARRDAERLNPLVLYGLIALLAIPPMMLGMLTGK